MFVFLFDTPFFSRNRCRNLIVVVRKTRKVSKWMKHVPPFGSIPKWTTGYFRSSVPEGGLPYESDGEWSPYLLGVKIRCLKLLMVLKSKMTTVGVFPVPFREYIKPDKIRIRTSFVEELAPLRSSNHYEPQPLNPILPGAWGGGGRMCPRWFQTFKQL